MQAEHMQSEARAERRRAAELDLQKAQYEAALAERRYAACDPDNRLIAATLEKNWEVALKRLEACKTRLDAEQLPDTPAKLPDLDGLAEDLQAAWNAPGVSTRARQRLARALIKDIIADVDEEARDVVLTIHWQGGQHSQLRVRKPKTGEHGCNTSEDALEVMRSMAGRWSDSDIAATLNRMGIRTGFGHTWTAHRVSSIRRVNDIHAYFSAEKSGKWLTMTEAATKLGVTNHVIRNLIKAKILPAEQVVPRAPYQIKAVDIEREDIIEAINNRRRKRPYRDPRQIALPINSIT